MADIAGIGACSVVNASRASFWSDVLATFALDGLSPVGKFIRARFLDKVCDAITFYYWDRPLADHTVTAPMLETAAKIMRAGPVRNLAEPARAQILEAERLNDARGIDSAMAVALVEVALFGRLILSPIETWPSWITERPPMH